METKTFIFIGRSGSGKGTQARLLQEYLKDIDPETPVLYIETGAKFREFLKEDTYTSELSKDIYKKGDLQPDFLAIRIWSEELRQNVNGNEHLLFDGTPRQLREAYILESALDFYKKDDVYIVYPNVSRKWSEERLMARGREDDKDISDVKRRLDWYDDKVAPVIEYYRANPRYKFIDVNGEQTIEQVYEEIKRKIFK
jgi:adenylate kinase